MSPCRGTFLLHSSWEGEAPAEPMQRGAFGSSGSAGASPSPLASHRRVALIWIVPLLGVVMLTAKMSLAQAPAGKPAVSKPAALAAGTKVDVKWGSSWYPSTIVRKEGDKYRIHYEGWSDKFDETVTVDRMRLPGGGAIAAPAVGGAASPEDAKSDDAKPGAPAKPVVAPRPAAPPRMGPKRPQRPGDAEVEPPVTEPDVSGVQELTLTEPAKWSVEPDRAALAARLFTNPIPMPRTGVAATGVGALSATFESLAGVLQGPTSQALVVHSNVPPGAPPSIRVSRCDLATGRYLGTQQLPANSLPIAWSPEGTRLLSRRNGFSTGEKDRLDLWSFDGGVKLKHVASWRPAATDDWTKSDVVWADFLDSTHILTLCKTGALVLWEAPKMRAVYRMSLSADAAPVLSASRKKLALLDSGCIYLLDPMSGATRGKLSSDNSRACETMAIRPDARQLIAWCGLSLVQWDLATGEVVREVSVPRRLVPSQIHWAGEGHVLLATSRNHYLIDLERHLPLWEYKETGAGRGDGPAVAVVGGRLFYPMQENRTGAAALFSVAAPSPEALQLAASLKPETLWVVKPGMKVSLRVDVAGTPAESAQVTESLKASLVANGLEVADGQELVLEASTRPGEEKEMAYQDFFRRAPQEKMRVQEYVNTVTFVFQGEPVWSTKSTYGAPSLLRLEKDQMIEQALAAASKFTPDYFGRVRLPKNVAKPPADGLAFGSSTLGAL